MVVRRRESQMIDVALDGESGGGQKRAVACDAEDDEVRCSGPSCERQDVEFRKDGCIDIVRPKKHLLQKPKDGGRDFVVSKHRREQQKKH